MSMTLDNASIAKALGRPWPLPQATRRVSVLVLDLNGARHWETPLTTAYEAFAAGSNGDRVGWDKLIVVMQNPPVDLQDEIGRCKYRASKFTSSPDSVELLRGSLAEARDNITTNYAGAEIKVLKH